MRCPQCASDNPPEYRFCGMCGTPLGKKESPAPEPVSVRHDAVREEAHESGPRLERVSRDREPVGSLSGPSFLGLGSEPVHGNGRSDSDISYLFDDEDVRPRRTYWRFTGLLLLVAIIGGLVYLQYRKEGKSWVAPWSNQKPTTPVQASQQPEPQAQPAQPGSPDTSNQGANTPAGSSANASPSENAQPNQPSATVPAQQGQKSASANAGSENASPDSAKSANPAASDNEDKDSAKTETPSEAASDAERAEAAPPSKPARPAKPKPARVATPAVSQDDALVANAEKYLYGRGVPQNCDRALSALRSAADRDNPRARTLLGTMYATGHCVPKDLPNAYRWFAQASRTSPDNMWVQRNLEMIWREMTPQERQLATKTQ